MDNTTKKHNPRLQMLFAVMVMAALFLAELYVMINYATNIVLLAGFAILILIALYFVIDAVMDCMNEKNTESKEQYDTIYRSERTSYTLLKKSLDEIAKQVEELSNGTGQKEDNSEEIIKAQKAIAKVTMAKSKEAQDRLFIELNNLEASLNYSIRGLSEKLSGFQEEIERLADHIAKINEEAIFEALRTNEEVKNTAIPEKENVVTPEEPVVLETIPEHFDFNDEEEMSEIAEEEPDFIEQAEEVPMEESVDDILSQLLAETEEENLEEKSLAEETQVEENVVEELEKAAEEPSGFTPPPDNGGKMDQDDIAALIASMTGGAEEPPKEEPAPAPVSSDPNKMMTPEEIAALIAGM